MNNKCTKSLHFAVALLLCAIAARLAPAQSGDNNQPASDPVRVADLVITGILSEEQFLHLELTADQKLDVFKAIRKERSWEISDDELAFALPDHIREKLSRPSRPFSPAGSTSKEASLKPNAAWIPGACNQEIHQEEGTRYASWPLYSEKARPGECGTDNDDVVLVYNTPNYPRTNPNNVRNWSPLWWVRWAMFAAYRPWGQIWANGLCGPVARGCLGSAGQKLGRDKFSIYLWEK